jgi:hypothetical protein
MSPPKFGEMGHLQRKHQEIWAVAGNEGALQLVSAPSL